MPIFLNLKAGNFVEITCAHEGEFDDGCWAGLGMNTGATEVQLESGSCSQSELHDITNAEERSENSETERILENDVHCFTHFKEKFEIFYSI